MRIVGGEWRGRALTGPSSSIVRPTSDRLRESMFNILAHTYGAPAPGARVIDVFAGTGALGLEALSRGAGFVQFVDDSAEGRALLRENTQALGAAGRSKIFRRDATRLGDMPPGQPYDLAFLDPPYGRGLAPLALASLAEGGWLAPQALLVVEEEARAEVSAPKPFELLEKRQYGDTQAIFLRYAPL
ncbi:MAG: rRNA ((966)-N(2))-methyltransferase RsmD [Hyphomicrobiales bacterium]|nr:rRNA ((966)-N(2))-methyltransferase RsmD [Hyphomicrobiales bacterium]